MQAGEELGARSDAAPPYRRVQLRRVGLLQLVLELHLRKPGRTKRVRGGGGAFGPRGRSALLPDQPGRRALLRLRDRSHRPAGADWQICEQDRKRVVEGKSVEVT